MEILKTGVIVIGIILMITGAAIRCYSGDSPEENAAMTMQGNVTAIDWVGSIIVVDNTEFTVSSNVKVRKGIDAAGFADINVGDSVMVTYSKKANGTLEAVKIVIAYSGDFPT